MCPLLSIAFEDLKPRRFYTVMIDFVLKDEFRYRYDVNCNCWVANSHPLPEEGWPRLYVHPNTPAMGVSLMQSVLTFKMLKLTNCPVTAAKSGQVSFVVKAVSKLSLIRSLVGITSRVHGKSLSM